MKSKLSLSLQNSEHRWISVFLIIMGVLITGFSSVQASTSLTVGFRSDFTFPVSQPTRAKPQSKLWFNDGLWWGILWSGGTSGAYHIYRLDESSQDWIDTGTIVDDRDDSKSDALWDEGNQKLYVASQRFVQIGETAAASIDRGKLRRYSYNTGSNTYTLDNGFPTDVNAAKSETLVLEKDSTGRLWVTYTRDQAVYVNHSGSSDTDWDPDNRPFVIPTGDNSVDITSDDISSITVFNNKIGVMWSNQSDEKMYFSVHPDSSSPTSGWSGGAVALSGNKLADDHINLASLDGDPAGEVFASTKTSETNARLMLLVCDSGCTSSNDWTAHTVTQESASVGNPTRPVVSIDTSNRELYVLATARIAGGNRNIYSKITDIDNIQFTSAGLGTSFIEGTNVSPNNTTLTKQNLNTSTGFVAVAATGNRYVHNQLILSGGGSVVAPTLAKSFAANPITSGDTTTLTLMLNNSNTVDLTAVAVNDSYPVEISNATPANVSTTCGGTVTAADGGGDVDLTGATIPSSGSCTVTVDVTSTTEGDHINTTGVISSTEAPDSATASDTLTVTPSGGGGGTVILQPTDDARVYFASPGTNYGSRTEIRVRGSGSNAYESYLQFAVTGVSGTVTSAKLRLFVTNGSPDGGDVYVVDNSWDESTITANNAPGISGSVIVSAGTVTAGAYIELDVTSAITGNGTISFGMQSGSTNSALYSSKEGANPPELMIQSSGGGGGSVAPTLAKSFSPTAITSGGTSTLTLMLSNSNAIDLTAVAVNDSYPVAIINATPASASTTCGGTLTAADGGGDVDLIGATIPSSGNCTVTVEVTSATEGSHINTTGVISSAEAPDSATASDTLTVTGGGGVVAPTLAKSFSPATITSGGTSTLILTLSNSNTIDLTAVAVNDPYPVEISNATPANVSTTCGGTVTAADGGGDVDLTGATIPSSGSCTVTVDVTSTTEGDHINTTGVISSTEAPDSATASDTLTVTPSGGGGGTVILQPTDDARVYFASPGTNYGSRTEIRVRGSGSNAYESYLQFAVTGVSGTVTSAKLRLFVTNGSPDGGDVYVVDNSWDESTITANNAPGISGSVIVSAGTVTAGAYIELDVTSAITGNGTISFGMQSGSSNSALYSSKEGANPPELMIQSSGGGGGSVAPTLAKSFSPTAITSGGTSTLTLTLSNSNAIDLTAVAVNDSYPVAIINATPASASTTCGGTLTAVDGGGDVDLIGATIPSSGNCTVTVDVTSATEGSHINTTGVISSAEAPDSATASDTLTVTGGGGVVAPTLAKSFSPATITSGGTSTLILTLSNSNTIDLTAVAVNDPYPVEISNATPANVSTTCGGTVTAADGGGDVDLIGATIPLSGNCTVTVEVTSTTEGSHVNTTGVISSTEAPDSTTASDTLTVTPSSGGGGTVTLQPTDDARVYFASPGTNYGSRTEIRVRGSGSNAYESYLQFAVTGVSGTVTSAKLRLFVTNGSPDGGDVYVVDNSWDDSTITANNAPGISGSVIVSAGTVTAGAYIELDVTSAITGNGTISFGMQSGSTNSALYSSKEGANPPELMIQSSGGGGGSVAPTLAKSFSPTAITSGGTSTLTLMLSNSNAIDLTAVAVNDSYPVAIINATPANASTTCGGTLTAVDGGADVDLSGATIPSSGNCTVTVEVTSATEGSHINTTGVISSAEAPDSATVSDTLTVTGGGGVVAPTLAKSFSPATITSGGTSTLILTLSNSNTIDLTAVAVNDPYPVEISNATPANVSTTCGGTVTAADGGGDVDLIGATIPLSGNCTVTVEVTSTTEGSHVNTTGVISSAEALDSATASDTLTVTPSGGGGGTVTLQPTDDARVYFASPNNNYGSLDHIRVRDSGANSHESYLQFAVTGVSGTVTSAKLRLFVTNGSPDGGDVYVVDNSWDESTITANNAPGISGSVIVSAGTVTAGAYIELDVTSAITGNGTISFGMQSGSSNSALYSSKEGANAPELVIDM